MNNFVNVLYVTNVLGLSRLHYFMQKNDQSLHDSYMLELLNAGYLEDISDFSEESKHLMSDNSGYFFSDNRFFSFPLLNSLKEKRLRTELLGQTIIQKYVDLSQVKLDIKFKEIKTEDMDRMIIIESDDGSESVLFSS